MFVAYFGLICESHYPFDHLALHARWRRLETKIALWFYIGNYINIYSVLPEHPSLRILNYAFAMTFRVDFLYTHILTNYSSHVGFKNRM